MGSACVAQSSIVEGDAARVADRVAFATGRRDAAAVLARNDSDFCLA